LLLQEEEESLREWRKQGPLGTIFDVINYIKMLQQHDLFEQCQRIAHRDHPGDKQSIIEPVKPVVTRWNSYCEAFERAAELQTAFNSYINNHIEKQRIADRHAEDRNNKLPDAPQWMRSGGLSANNWQVLT
jgi:hypothetical protein